jgi:hypothetical protein
MINKEIKDSLKKTYSSFLVLYLFFVNSYSFNILNFGNNASIENANYLMIIYVTIRFLLYCLILVELIENWPK